MRYAPSSRRNSIPSWALFPRRNLVAQDLPHTPNMVRDGGCPSRCRGKPGAVLYMPEKNLHKSAIRLRQFLLDDATQNSQSNGFRFPVAFLLRLFLASLDLLRHELGQPIRAHGLLADGL